MLSQLATMFERLAVTSPKPNQTLAQMLRPPPAMNAERILETLSAHCGSEVPEGDTSGIDAPKMSDMTQLLPMMFDVPSSDPYLWFQCSINADHLNEIVEYYRHVRKCPHITGLDLSLFILAKILIQNPELNTYFPKDIVSPTRIQPSFSIYSKVKKCNIIVKGFERAVKGGLAKFSQFLNEKLRDTINDEKKAALHPATNRSRTMLCNIIRKNKQIRDALYSAPLPVKYHFIGHKFEPATMYVSWLSGDSRKANRHIANEGFTGTTWAGKSAPLLFTALPAYFQNGERRISLCFGLDHRVPIPAALFSKMFIQVWEEVFSQLLKEAQDHKSKSSQPCAQKKKTKKKTTSQTKTAAAPKKTKTAKKKTKKSSRSYTSPTEAASAASATNKKKSRVCGRKRHSIKRLSRART